MHEAQMMFCEEVKRKYPNYFNAVKVLDIGSMDINGNNRHLFENSEYVGCDLARISILAIPARPA